MWNPIYIFYTMKHILINSICLKFKHNPLSTNYFITFSSNRWRGCRQYFPFAYIRCSFRQALKRVNIGTSRYRKHSFRLYPYLHSLVSLYFSRALSSQRKFPTTNFRANFPWHLCSGFLNFYSHVAFHLYYTLEGIKKKWKSQKSNIR